MEVVHDDPEEIPNYWKDYSSHALSKIKVKIDWDYPTAVEDYVNMIEAHKNDPNNNIPVPEVEENLTTKFNDIVNLGVDFVFGAQIMNESTLELFEGPEGKQWRKSTRDEYDTFLDKDVVSLVRRPQNTKVHKPKVIHAKKDEGDGRIRYKTRCVLAGWSMRKGIDYKETFSPTVRQDSLKAVLAIAVQKGYNILQFDYKTAYLNSKLKEPVYMEIPPGFDVEELLKRRNTGLNKFSHNEFVKRPDKFVLKVNKAIYGTPQAGRYWNEDITKFLVSLGYV
jgi:hypothetical protein